LSFFSRSANPTGVWNPLTEQEFRPLEGKSDGQEDPFP
jgi:hypothetical protein